MYIKTPKFLTNFKCLIDKCLYHCCGGWIININDNDIQKYQAKAPELLYYVEEYEDSDGEKALRIKRDDNRICKMIENGMCRIHRDYGADLLPNICSYFPRLQKQMPESILETASISCHGVMKVALFQNNRDAFKIIEYNTDSKKDEISDFTNLQLNEQKCFDLYHKFLEITYQQDINFEKVAKNLYLLTKTIGDTSLEEIYDNFDEIFNNIDDENVEISLISQEKLILMMEFMVSGLKPIPVLSVELEKLRKSMGLENKTSSSKIIDIEKYNNFFAKWKKYGYKYDFLLRNYLRAKLSEDIFPICIYNPNNRLDDLIIKIIECCVVRLFLCNLINDNGEIVNENEMMRVFSVVARRFYSVKSDVKNQMLADLLNKNNDNLFGLLLI